MTATPVLLDAMTPEAKRELLAALIRDLSNGRDLLSVQDAGREYFIYVSPANARARAEEVIRNTTPEEWAELQRRANDPDNSFTIEEALQMNWEETAKGR